MRREVDREEDEDTQAAKSSGEGFAEKLKKGKEMKKGGERTFLNEISKVPS